MGAGDGAVIVQYGQVRFQDLRGRVNQTFFAPVAAWKRLFFLHIFALGENVEEKEKKYRSAEGEKTS